MDIAALILWIATAGGGFVLFGTWIAKGGARRDGATRFPPAVIFGHFLLAATGLVLWIVYVAASNKTTGWVAFAILAAVALLGFTMFARWVPTYLDARKSQPVPAHAMAGAGARSPSPSPLPASSADPVPAERHFPVPIVIGHGLLAATTLVLVLLTMLGVG